MKPPRGTKWLVLLLILMCFTVVGCVKPAMYVAVPECEIATPPNAERFLDAGVDERLILMTNSYIRASKNAAKCNSEIKATNAANKAVAP